MRLLFIDFTIPHLFVDADYPVGGWAVELRTWLKGLRRIGVETAIVTTRDGAVAAGAVEDTVLLPAYVSRGRIPGLAYVWQFLPGLLGAARRFRPDVVIQAVAGMNTGLMAMVARLLRRPFVYRCANDIDVDNRYRSRLGPAARVAFAWGFARADGYVAQNGYQLGEIRRRFPGKPAIVLHNPFSVHDEPLPARGERGYVAWLGVFQPQKNLPLLATIAAALPDVVFHIAGKLEVTMTDQPTHAALDRLKTLPNVTFVGYLRRTQVPGFLSRALMLVSTSHYEGFSNTFLEAWGCGTPMVAPARVDPDGLIADQGLGRAVAEDAGMVAAIRELIDLDPVAYEVLSARCADYVRAAHDPEKLATRLITFLRYEVAA